MGYETRLYIVEKYNWYKADLINVENNVYQVYDKNHYYLADDTKANINQEQKAGMINVFSCYTLAMIEMCKMGLSFGSICKFKDSDICCSNPTNGNAYLGLDLYGDYRKFVPLNKAIYILTEAIKTDKYRRYDIALATMKSIKKGFKDNNIGVLEYGH